MLFDYNIQFFSLDILEQLEKEYDTEDNVLDTRQKSKFFLI